MTGQPGRSAAISGAAAPMSVFAGFVRNLFQSTRCINRVVVWAMLVSMAGEYILRYRQHAYHPQALGETGWWLWNDQALYIRATRAWAAGMLDPAQHWYLPGYPLLGAAFNWLTPIDPFYVPDLACLLAFGWLISQLAAELAPELRWARSLGALSFFVTIALSPLAIRSFVVPWTTTPTAPLACASLLLALRFRTEPSMRRAAWLGLVTMSAILFRPTEAALMTAVVGTFAGLTLLRLAKPLTEKARIAVAAVAGTAVPVLVMLAIYHVLYGWTESGYFALSKLIGFEWRLIPLRWVTLFISPQPLFTGELEYGLARVFPWIIPGIAGMIACLAASSGPARARHALVIGAATVHVVAYLAYRDLHPQGLIRFGNYHYFKWLLPVFGIYAIFLVVLVGRSPRRVAAWGVAAAMLVPLFSWRAEWVTPASGYQAGDARVEAPRTLVLAHGLHSLRDGVWLAASGDWAAIYTDPYEMTAGGVEYRANADLKSYPVDGGLLFTALRPTAPGPAIVTFNPGVTLDDTIPPRIGREELVFGWPCLEWRVQSRLRQWWRAVIPPSSGADTTTESQLCAAK